MLPLVILIKTRDQQLFENMAASGATEKRTVTSIMLPIKDIDQDDTNEDDSVENDDFLDNDENDAVAKGALHIRSQRCPCKEGLLFML